MAKNEFQGMTHSECPDACGPDGCVISGKNVCAHPRKGGLQGGNHDSETVERFHRARKALNRAAVDKE